jgi:hypothetical protein
VKAKQLLTRAATALAVGCVVVEGVARWGLGLGQPPLTAVHPRIEYLFAPNQDVYRFGNHFVTNAWGMRSRSFPAKKLNPDELRVLIFGDSVVNGGSLTDQEELATAIVERRLAEQLDRPVLVANISAGSWGPGNWLAFANEYGFFDADYIILVSNSGDDVDCPTFQPLDPNTHPFAAPWCAASELFSRYVPRYLPAVFAPLPTVAPPIDEAEALRQGLNDMKEFLEMAQSQTTNVFVIQYLDRSEIADATTAPGFAHINKLCGKLKIPVDSTRRFFLPNDVNQSFRDDIHPTADGQRKLADAIVESVFVSSPNSDKNHVEVP